MFAMVSKVTIMFTSLPLIMDDYANNDEQQLYIDFNELLLINSGFQLIFYVDCYNISLPEGISVSDFR